MSNIAIRVENLGKRYRIGAAAQRRDSLRELIVDTANAPFRNLNRLRRMSSFREGEEDDVLWALRDVSFEVRTGDTLGIIGRNGAGKSTLLKILSRIIRPTAGLAEVHGRVGSLLEVGTGFHPELTGRDNIFLNGSILGMDRGYIKRHFDEIVEFSGIERFIDTPVKRYSSGMYTRLAFAVAAHLEPEVLIVDEVLAVGDAVFQRKCLGKMGEVARQGRTVLFVSHQLAMVQTLCARGLLLVGGKAVMDGPADQVVQHYVRLAAEEAPERAEVSFAEDEHLDMQVVAAAVRPASGVPDRNFDVFEPLELRVDYIVRRPVAGAAVTVVMRRNGEILFVSFDTDNQPELLGPRAPGRYSASVRLPSPLKSGRYTADLGIGRLNASGVDSRPSALTFEIEERSFDTSMRSYSNRRPGSMAVHLPWNTQAIEAADTLSPDSLLISSGM